MCDSIKENTDAYVRDLRDNYELGEPIFSVDIALSGLSEDNLRYHLKKLTDDGVLCRFGAGVYYFPKKDIFGEKIPLTEDIVVLHKYIRRRGKRVGYYSGYTLANRLGLSTQVPFIEEITSNFAPASVRELTLKNRKYIIKRPVVEVTDDNVAEIGRASC